MTSYGGFTQIAVGPIPIQVCPPLGDGTTVTIYNQDSNNVVTLGTTSNISIGATNGVPLQPLTPGTFPATKAIYAIAPSGTQALVIIPEGGTLSPSPAQIAAQIAATGLATSALQTAQETSIPNNIAATGVPAVLSSVIGTIGPIASGSAWGPITFTFTTGGAYQITFLPTVAGNTCISDVSVTHIDSGGSTTYQERFTISTAGGLGNLGCIIRGNLYGNRIQVSGTTGTQAQVNAIFASSPTVTGFSANVYSRPYVEDTVPKMLPLAFDGALLFNSAVAIGASVSSLTIGVLQPYAGKAFCSIQSGTGGGFNLATFIKSFQVAVQPYVTWFPTVGGADTAGLDEFTLDTRIHLMQVTNLAAVAGTGSFSVTAEDFI
jgi:hypothetical protein